MKTNLLWIGSLAVASVLNVATGAEATGTRGGSSRPPQTRTAPPVRTQPTPPVRTQPQPQPRTQPPVVKPPVQQPPVVRPPVQQPRTQPPVVKPPTVQPPVQQPRTQPPVVKPPTVQPPVQQPRTQPPVVKPPTQQPPVVKPPTNNHVQPPANNHVQPPANNNHVQPPQPHTPSNPVRNQPPTSNNNNRPTTPVNLKPVAPSHKVTHPDGSATVTHGTRTTYYRPDGTKVKETRGKTTVDYHGDGSHSVARNGVNQYTQTKPVQHNDGRTYIQRTTNVKNVTVVKNYRTYVRGSYSYQAYVPVVFEPSVYAYAYTPWRSTFVYRWGWEVSPWYVDYGYYYHPYVTYYTPSAWLTDYFISSTLEASYLARLADQTAALNAATARANAAATAPVQQPQPQPQPQPTVVNVNVQINDEVKAQIKAQVEEAIRAHERQQPVELHEVMRDAKHLYAVTEDIDAVIVPACGGQTGVDCSPVPPENALGCSLEGGDLIRVAQAPADNAVGATVQVVTARKDSCPRGSYVLISLHDLQEMQNNFSEKVEEGLTKMKTDVAPVQK